MKLLPVLAFLGTLPLAFTANSFFSSAEANELRKIQKELSECTDPLSLYPTLIEDAVSRGHLLVFDYVLNRWNRARFVDLNELLFSAITFGKKDLVARLVERGASVNYKSPLIHAVNVKNPEIVEFLLNKGADIEKADDFGYTALNSACFYGEVEIVNILLERGASALVPGSFGGTALITAVANGHEAVVKCLLESGREIGINVQNDEDGDSALMIAVLIRAPRIVRMLLVNRADIGLTNNVGNTALHLATGQTRAYHFGRIRFNERVYYHDNTEERLASRHAIIKLLMSAGSNVQARNAAGKTPPMIAIEEGRADFVMTLTKRILI